jgi:hypothetical protein
MMDAQTRRVHAPFFPCRVASPAAGSPFAYASIPLVALVRGATDY